MTMLSPDARTSEAAQLGTRAGASEDGPVTGPVPAVDLLGGHLHVSQRRGATIVAVDGGLDDALVARLVPAIEEAVETSSAVIVDVDRVTLLDRSAIEAVLACVDRSPAGPARCVVAGRLSGRLVLDRWGIASECAVFTSVADALQARTFVENGYGNGWSAPAQ